MDEREAFDCESVRQLIVRAVEERLEQWMYLH